MKIKSKKKLTYFLIIYYFKTNTCTAKIIKNITLKILSIIQKKLVITLYVNISILKLYQIVTESDKFLYFMLFYFFYNDTRYW